VAERRQVLSVAAGATGGVQCRTGRQAIQDRADVWLLQIDEPVPRLVIVAAQAR
jgi:hypothetical protein